jgi:hypothetical protein
MDGKDGNTDKDGERWMRSGELRLGGNDFNINAQKRVNNVQPNAQPLKKKLQPPMEGGAGSADQSVAEQ